MNFDNWASAFLGGIVLFIAVLTKETFRKMKSDMEKTEARIDGLSDRVVKVELTTVTEEKVRHILKEMLEPLTESNHKIEGIVRQIELQMAAIPKRKDDK